MKRGEAGLGGVAVGLGGGIVVVVDISAEEGLFGYEGGWRTYAWLERCPFSGRQCGLVTDDGGQHCNSQCFVELVENDALLVRRSLVG